VVAIAAGDGHTVVLKRDGTVWAWGRNWSGQLGDGTYTNRATPVAVSGLTEVIAIAAGMEYTVALKSDGTAWAWGSNEYGQLGDGTVTNRCLPVPVVWGSGSSPVLGVAGIAVTDPVMNLMRGDYLFRLWGRVKSEDSSGFGTDDGTGVVVRVSCRGYSGIATGDFITATGTLSSSTPPTLNCLPNMITKLQ
jgi:hypothetical protein